MEQNIELSNEEKFELKLIAQERLADKDRTTFYQILGAGICSLAIVIPAFFKYAWADFLAWLINFLVQFS